MHCGREGRGRMLEKWPPQETNSWILWKALSSMAELWSSGGWSIPWGRGLPGWGLPQQECWGGRHPLPHPAFSASLFSLLACLWHVSNICPYFTSCHVLGYFFSLPEQIRTIFSMIHSGRKYSHWNQHPFRRENVAQVIRKYVTLYLADLIPKDLENIISRVGGRRGI